MTNAISKAIGVLLISLVSLMLFNQNFVNADTSSSLTVSIEVNGQNVKVYGTTSSNKEVTLLVLDSSLQIAYIDQTVSNNIISTI